MDDCFQVKEENIEYKEAKENFHAISENDTEIEIKEEPLENNEFKDTKDNFLEKAANDTDIEIKEEPLETIVENYVGVSEIKPEQSEELSNIYDPLNVTSVHEEKKLLKCDVGSKMRNGNRQVRCFCKVYLSCTNTITNPLDFQSIYQKEKLTKLENKLRCIICSMNFANRAQLEEHARSVHEKLKPFKCTICDTKFARKCGLVLHNRTIHEKKKPFKCTICHSEFACKDYLEKHICADHDKLKPFKCMLCNSKFASIQWLGRHTIAVHEENSSSQRDTLKRHAELDFDLPNDCQIDVLDEVKKPKDQNDILKTQAPSVSENKPKALKCGLVLHTKAIHEKKKPFKCTICHSEFACKDYLEKHTGAVHEKLKPFKCTHCNSKFASKQYLERHYWHTIAVHVLDEAKKQKDQNDILETQASSVSENNPKARQKKQQISERTTFKEKKEELIKWKCDFCSATYFNKKDLDRHITLQLHCKLCKKNFQSKRNLNVHVASVHQGMKPFECSVCNSRFSLKQNMVRHIAFVHKVNKTV